MNMMMYNYGDGDGGTSERRNTLLVIKMEYLFSPQFHGIFLAVGNI